MLVTPPRNLSLSSNPNYPQLHKPDNIPFFYHAYTVLCETSIPLVLEFDCKFV